MSKRQGILIDAREQVFAKAAAQIQAQLSAAILPQKIQMDNFECVLFCNDAKSETHCFQHFAVLSSCANALK